MAKGRREWPSRGQGTVRYRCIARSLLLLQRLLVQLLLSHQRHEGSGTGGHIRRLLRLQGIASLAGSTGGRNGRPSRATCSHTKLLLLLLLLLQRLLDMPASTRDR